VIQQPKVVARLRVEGVPGKHGEIVFTGLLEVAEVLVANREGEMVDGLGIRDSGLGIRDSGFGVWGAGLGVGARLACGKGAVGT
jgi:hypothetical protein